MAALLAAAAIPCLGACAAASGEAGAIAAAAASGLEPERVAAGNHVLATRHRGLDAPSPLLVVYVEGDGRAWSARGRPPRDPTPADPLALRLAAADPAPSVLWIARPCQYRPGGPGPGCHVRDWTTHRYAEAAVSAVDAVVERAQRGARGRHVGLVGYSGGGVIAALVAARRSDVAWLVTVAAPLDHRAWTAHHDLGPLTGSLEPIAFAARLRDVPQRHLAGARDEVVPAAVIASYARAVGGAAAGSVEVIEGFDHRCCWAGAWPAIARRAPIAVR